MCTRSAHQFLLISSYVEIYYKNFSKDSGLVEVETKILPQIINTKSVNKTNDEHDKESGFCSIGNSSRDFFFVHTM